MPQFDVLLPQGYGTAAGGCRGVFTDSEEEEERKGDKVAGDPAVLGGVLAEVCDDPTDGGTWEGLLLEGRWVGLFGRTEESSDTWG